MASRTHVQLIEKTNLRSSVWLTFWDLQDRAQLSVQLNSPAPDYEVGEVFRLDRTAKRAELALTPSSAKIDEKLLLVPRKDSSPGKGTRGPGSKWVYQKVVSPKVKRNTVVVYAASVAEGTKVVGETLKKKVFRRKFVELNDKGDSGARKSSRGGPAASTSVQGTIIK